MRIVAIILGVFFFIFLLAEGGCEQPQIPPEPPAETYSGFDRFSTYAPYAAEKINILPLTEFIDVGDAQQAQIHLYVSLLDSFGSQIKSPGVFRFELYERVLRSAEPKGKRVFIWEDIDLTDPVKNNDRWRDFLRAYEFNLPFEPVGSQSYILLATCLCPSGRRLSAEFILKPTK
jgi:hypothetical protein